MKLANVIICDGVRKEEGGKHLIIGVYPDDILVADFPATVALCAWVQFLPDQVGEIPIEIRVVQNKRELIRGTAKLVIINIDKSVTAVLSPLLMEIRDEGPLKFQCKEKKKRWRTMKILGVGKSKG